MAVHVQSTGVVLVSAHSVIIIDWARRVKWVLPGGKGGGGRFAGRDEAENNLLENVDDAVLGIPGLRRCDIGCLAGSVLCV